METIFFLIFPLYEENRPVILFSHVSYYDAPTRMAHVVGFEKQIESVFRKEFLL